MLRLPFASVQAGFGRADPVGAPIADVRTPADVLAASAAVNLLALALPIAILQIYDRVLPNASFDTLNALVIGLIACALADVALKYARAYTVNWSAAAWSHNAGAAALSSLLSTRPHIHKQTANAKHLERLSALSSVGDFFSGASRLIIVDLLFIPLFALVIIIVGGVLFVVPLTLFAVFGWLAVRRSKVLRQLIGEREETDARKSDFIIEVLEAMPTVKAHTMEAQMLRRFERLQLGDSDVMWRTIKLMNAAQASSALYASLSVVAIVGAGAYLVINGRLTTGGLACCMLLSSQMLQPLMRTLSGWNEIDLADQRRRKVAALFDDGPPTANDAPPAEAARVVRPATVRFTNVAIAYDESKPLFSNLNVVFEAGGLYAVGGADGSGRTSLLRALVGSHGPTSGDIEIGGVALCDENAQQIRDAVRYVGQQPSIFRGTILENLSTFGRTPIDACLCASRLIKLDADIIQMPLGYDTPLEGAHAATLPASLAQRLCIARAIATEPALLILDEANTALDRAGEEALIAALEELRGRVTVVFATHRPSITRLATQAYEIRSGELHPVADPTDQRRSAS